MSQYPPPQPYPQQGPPMGPPPMGGPPMYGPPPKKKGIVLLVLGLLLLIIGGILIAVGVGGGASMVEQLENFTNPQTTLIAPGEQTFQLEEGGAVIIAWDSLTMGGQTYAPTDQFPTSDTTITVTDGQGNNIPIDSSGGQSSLDINENHGQFVGTFEAPADGAYTLSVTSSGQMQERAFSLLKESDAMALVGGVFAILGGVCGGVLAVVGLILLVIWLIVRK